MFYENRDYDYEYNNPSPDFIHIDDVPTAKTQDFIEGIKEAIYVTGSIETLENCLEELCGLYDIKFEDKKCLVSSKTLLSNHLNNQMSHINTLMGRV